MVIPAELKNYHSFSETRTRQYGGHLARLTPRPPLILLQGELGAGKTQLAKGLILGLGAVESEAEVVSPSYTLIHEYAAPGFRVYHLDLYRLESVRDLASLGLDDFIARAAGTEPPLVLVEWGAKLAQAGNSSWFAGGWLEVRLEIISPDERKITSRWRDRIDQAKR